MHEAKWVLDPVTNPSPAQALCKKILRHLLLGNFLCLSIGCHTAKSPQISPNALPPSNSSALSKTPQQVIDQSGSEHKVWLNRDSYNQTVQMSCVNCSTVGKLNGKDVVEVFYATDRTAVFSATDNRTSFTAEPSPSSTITYGTALVSIPPDHRMGELESPSFWKFEVSSDPEKHVTLIATSVQREDDFFSHMRERERRSPEREALIFVHGFDTSFDDAIRRTAQLSYDLGFDGAAVAFSWPSADSLLSYARDEETVQWSSSHLAALITAVSEKSGARVVHVIAHSMGNRALLSALSGMQNVSLGEVIFAAPDLSVLNYKQLVPRLPKDARGFTLYASSKDEALITSQLVHRYPRAGESGKSLTIVPPVETIDATGIDTSLIGHSYYGENTSIVSDLFYLIHQQLPASQRARLKVKTAGSQTYWAFEK